MIYTSYFDNAYHIEEKFGYRNFVSVAGFAPVWFMEFSHGRRYPALAPRKEWWREWRDNNLGSDWYRQKYQETVLSRLNPEKVAEDLGENPILLCYEKPGEFCHRILISEWFNSHGIPSCEFNL